MMTNNEIDSTPRFPVIPMVSLCFGMLAHSVVLTSPLPYVAFMVVDFGLADNVDKAGYYAGWIVGSFMIGRSIVSILWGMSSDYFGRKPCLMLSMINVTIFGIGFGFSNSFLMAISFRVLTGLGNGFMGVAKTAVTEICSCKEHEVRGFGLLNAMWGLGLIVGPAVGGLLARPSVLYPKVFSSNGFWGRFPYLLPCLVCAMFAVISFLIIAFFLPETGGKFLSSQQKSRIGVSLQSDGKGVQMGLYSSPPKSLEEEQEQEEIGLSRSTHSLLHRSLSLTESDEEVEGGGGGERGGKEKEGKIRGTEEEEEEETHIQFHLNPNNNNTNENNTHTHNSLPSSSSSPLPTTFSQLIRTKRIQLVLFIYFGFCFIVMVADEVFPLWAVTSLPHRGLNWSTAQVGSVLASCGTIIILFQFTLYEPMIRYMCTRGDSDTFIRLGLVIAVSLCLLPYVSTGVLEFIHQYKHQHLQDTHEIQNRYNILLQLSVIFILAFFRMAVVSQFSTLGLIVNSCVGKELRGTLNGLVMTCGSLGNAIGPILAASLYAFLASGGLNQSVSREMGHWGIGGSGSGHYHQQHRYLRDHQQHIRISSPSTSPSTSSSSFLTSSSSSSFLIQRIGNLALICSSLFPQNDPSIMNPSHSFSHFNNSHYNFSINNNNNEFNSTTAMSTNSTSYSSSQFPYSIFDGRLIFPLLSLLTLGLLLLAKKYL